ncbi:unnamed protein product [Danaus chrysippus]|uniref:(African queen) hypothetical protein n=1 Tax=Danaus chrysippus TaxID=151541 RepID=A0A8J2QXN5_9NEOP|nr:unnamed protein product [Danaus chrysippus]
MSKECTSFESWPPLDTDTGVSPSLPSIMWRGLCATLFCAVLISADSFKRAEMSPSPFVLSSRYGRSPQRMMAPRNDRFFMSGRYGKRAELVNERDNKYDISDIINTNERDRYRSGDRDRERQEILRKWEPKCDCLKYQRSRLFQNYYKRSPETVDFTMEEN